MSKKSLNKIIGNLGESVACEYLIRHGYTILERNYRKPWVEIDIIVEKGTVVHFVEVKTASFATRSDLERRGQSEYRLEELLHTKKLRQLSKGVETWLIEHQRVQEVQVDAMMIKLVPSEKYASVSLIENVL